MAPWGRGGRGGARGGARAPSGQPGAEGVCGAPLRGSPAPLGASVSPAPSPSGASVLNFAVPAATGPRAARAWLLLFDGPGLARGRPVAEVELCPVANRTGGVWHVGLPDLAPGLLYGWQLAATGEPGGPGAAHRTPLLLDPRARAVCSSRGAFGQLGPDLAPAAGLEGLGLGLGPCWPLLAAPAPDPVRTEFDWEGDRPPRVPWGELVVYELHVRGFTRDPSSGVAAPGTYAGAVERLDHLQRLGVTAVELLPCMEFNELEYYELPPPPGRPPRYNFWGYSTVCFFAPMARYSEAVSRGGGASAEAAQAAVDEFKALVKACHARGIEVIMDVVFNHTAEGNARGPALSFKGFDEKVFYMLAPGGEHYNFSGCGNTVNCNHPEVRRFIVDCLRYWVTEMHVDGFRFDLASIMTRQHSFWRSTNRAAPQNPPPSGTVGGDLASSSAAAAAAGAGTGAGAGAASTAMPATTKWPVAAEGEAEEQEYISDPAAPTGTPLEEPPLLAEISHDPFLQGVKLIAEAWDCDGLVQVGAFPHYGGRWAEWNGEVRDAVRQFVKGTDGPWAGKFASALCGSPDIFGRAEADPDDWWGTHAGARWRGGRGPGASVNFVTAHDGFTLADLVAFNDKRNDENGEENRDGEDHNLSWNCGAEGPTADRGALLLRERQQRNLTCALLLAQGVPMVAMGDEYGHSKGGNNNTYCHDSPLNWFQWDALETRAGDFVRFFRHLLHFRRARLQFRSVNFLSDSEVQWHGKAVGEPDWSDSSRLVAFTLAARGDSPQLYVAFNSSHKAA